MSIVVDLFHRRCGHRVVTRETKNGIIYECPKCHAEVPRWHLREGELPLKRSG